MPTPLYCVAALTVPCCVLCVQLLGVEIGTSNNVP